MRSENRQKGIPELTKNKKVLERRPSHKTLKRQSICAQFEMLVISLYPVARFVVSQCMLPLRVRDNPSLNAQNAYPIIVRVY
jgi:hypothetical protein